MKHLLNLTFTVHVWEGLVIITLWAATMLSSYLQGRADQIREEDRYAS